MTFSGFKCKLKAFITTNVEYKIKFTPRFVAPSDVQKLVNKPGVVCILPNWGYARANRL